MDVYDLRSDQLGYDVITLAPGSTLDRPDQMIFGDGALRIGRAARQSCLVIAGDIDEFTHVGLTAALSTVAGSPGEIHIDLAGVEYCDVAGLRAFVALSEATRLDHDDHGGRVILYELPPHLEALLQILGWDSTPGLVIAEPSGGDGPSAAAVGAPWPGVQDSCSSGSQHSHRRRDTNGGVAEERDVPASWTTFRGA